MSLSKNQIENATRLATIPVAALLAASMILAVVSSQQANPAMGQTNQSGLKFFIKYSKSTNGTSTSQGAATTGATNSTSASATKKSRHKTSYNSDCSGKC